METGVCTVVYLVLVYEACQCMGSMLLKKILDPVIL